jgi:cytochrome c peroxidase
MNLTVWCRRILSLALPILIHSIAIGAAPQALSAMAEFRSRPQQSLSEEFEWLGDGPDRIHGLASSCLKVGADFTGVYSEERASCRRGASLFVERGLSGDGQVACSDCHRVQSRYGMASSPQIVVTGDGQRRPRVRNGDLALPRTPSLVDAGWKTGRFFWNGRAPSLVAAVYWPLFAHDEIGATTKSLDPFGGADQVAQDIGSFLASLRLGRAPWDEFVDGNERALSNEQQRGLSVFKQLGCPGCHAGQELSSQSLVALSYRGLPADLFRQAEAVYLSDSALSGPARSSVRLWSVPRSLRNLHVRGGPWGRFGQSHSLAEFILLHCSQRLETMAVCRRTPSAQEQEDLLRFLLGALRSFDG